MTVIAHKRPYGWQSCRCGIDVLPAKTRTGRDVKVAPSEDGALVLYAPWPCPGNNWDQSYRVSRSKTLKGYLWRRDQSFREHRCKP